MKSTEYFASLSREEIAPELFKRVTNWYDLLVTSGLFNRMRKSYMMYYGLSGTGTSSEIVSAGVQGELSLMKVNHFRNLLQHMLIMTTSTRPAMEARAYAAVSYGNGSLSSKKAHLGRQQRRF